MENSSDYFSNRACKYFPCHKGADPDRFNCLFCFCPLYFLGRSCGGNFKYNKKGAKDCTYCQVPHKPENYDMIMEKLRLAIEAAAEAELAQQH
ncbi:MAG: cysteine-rich small domain-containing protein [Actinomycetia bacterium]|nr:cysteine-rich small domain-containing protein [Actinomycetes bacterium]